MNQPNPAALLNPYLFVWHLRIKLLEVQLHPIQILDIHWQMSSPQFQLQMDTSQFLKALVFTALLSRDVQGTTPSPWTEKLLQNWLNALHARGLQHSREVEAGLLDGTNSPFAASPFSYRWIVLKGMTRHGRSSLETHIIGTLNSHQLHGNGNNKQLRTTRSRQIKVITTQRRVRKQRGDDLQECLQEYPSQTEQMPFPISWHSTAHQHFAFTVEEKGKKAGQGHAQHYCKTALLDSCLCCSERHNSRDALVAPETGSHTTAMKTRHVTCPKRRAARSTKTYGWPWVV